MGFSDEYNYNHQFKIVITVSIPNFPQSNAKATAHNYFPLLKAGLMHSF